MSGTLGAIGEAVALLRARRAAKLPALTRDELANELYWTLHCRVPTDDASAREAPGTWGEVSAFAERLARANSGTGPWQSGWLVHRASARGYIEVRAYGVNFTARTDDVRVAGKVRPGAAATVRAPNEFRHFAPGYYTALGDRDHDAVSTPTVRVYWNVPPAGAAALVGELTRRLNAAGIPFRFKTPSDPARFLRCDTGVLYLPTERFAAARPHIARVHRVVREYLRAPLSALVLKLGRGLAMAHDPGDGSSFGAHRCALLADALFAEPTQAATTDDAKVRAAADVLRARGYDPARLFLGPSTT
jgi:hypothetical protein